MLAIHISVHVAPVCGALSHGDHGNCTAPIVLKFFMAQSTTNWHNTHTHVDRMHSLTHVHQHSYNHFVWSASSAINYRTWNQILFWRYLECLLLFEELPVQSAAEHSERVLKEVRIVLWQGVRFTTNNRPRTDVINNKPCGQVETEQNIMEIGLQPLQTVDTGRMHTVR